MTRKRYTQSITEALFEEMERDPRVILFGEDVEAGIMGDTVGLRAHFGPDRVRNTPICEATMTGMAVGAAASGYRVILHLMFANFIYTGMDAIANQMAKMRLMTGGQVSMPITIMATYGGGRSTAAQHADCPHPTLMNLGGVNVAMPASSADAKGLLKTAIRGNNPTFFLQAGGRGAELGEVPDGEHLVPLGCARVLQQGHDVTVVAVGTMVKHGITAARTLADEGVSVDLIDPRTVAPLDTDTIIASVRRTGRLVVVDEARDRCSAASHICAVVTEHCFAELRQAPRRVTVPNVAMPFAPEAEKALLPNPERIVTTVRSLFTRAPAARTIA